MRMGYVALGTAVLGCASFVCGDDQRASRLADLESRLAELETRQSADAADLARSIDRLLRDAEQRSQLFANSGDVSAGYDNQFFIRAGDAWIIRPGAQFQFRHTVNYRDHVNDEGANDSDVNDGFTVRRMRFDLSGKAFTRNLDYLFQWESPRNASTMNLLEAWARYMFTDDWGVRLGQFKDPTTHEFVMSTKRQLFVETSMADSLIGGGGIGSYTQGVLLVYGNYSPNNPLNVEVGLTDGAAQFNTDFTDRVAPLSTPESFTGTPPAHAFNFGVAGRAEYKVFGDWKNYGDFTAKGTKQDLLVIGAGGDFSQSGDGDLILSTIDAQYENPSGLGLYGAVLNRYLGTAINGGHGDTDDWGALIQCSYLFNGNWEVFARYDVTLLDNDVTFADGAKEDTFHEITIGLNYYLGQDGSAGHRAKITVDLTYLPNGAPRSLTGLGILDDNSAHDEWILRSQFQLLL